MAHRKIFLALLFAIAFTIPLSKVVLPWLIVLLALNWLIEGEYLKTFPLIFKERTRFFIFSFSFLYILYLIGLIHTTNFQYAGEDLGMKLSILLFPLIFATSRFPILGKKETGVILRVFAAGCIAGSLIFLGRACYHTFFLHQSGAFYYTSLAWNFHPSYYALYLTFAVSNILWFFLVAQSVKGFLKTAMHVLILLFFTLMIVLLSSKSGLLIWLAVVGFYVAILAFRYKRWLTVAVFLPSALIAFFLFMVIFPSASGRVSQAKQDLASADTAQNASRSTNERVLIWKSSQEIIKQNGIFGVGTGDVRDELMAEYQRREVMGVLKHYLNAHNQYVQTFIALGIIGLLLLVTMIVMPAIYSIKKEHYLYFAFLFMTGISMFFESMFERQEGVVFYAFFNTLLFASAFALNEPEPVKD
ncbi:MAG: O-antigen ligase family protein [Bacteroidetes bacterium]|nr:O-antigen ligase family protein [Bacteroidota bacterium]